MGKRKKEAAPVYHRVTPRIEHPELRPNQEHVALLLEGAEAWNTWRNEQPESRPNLQGASLVEANLNFTNLQRANLTGADLSRAGIHCADFSYAKLPDADLSQALGKANFNGADLTRADFSFAHIAGSDFRGSTLPYADLNSADARDSDFSGAHLDHARLRGGIFARAVFVNAILSEADLSAAICHGADFEGARMDGANLQLAQLVQASLVGTNLSGCHVYGVSVWDANLTDSKQANLVITPPQGGPEISVDHLEVAEFMYLLLNNRKLRNVIDTITSKVVLILGRFTPERKDVLDAIRDELRKRDYVPVLFDFEKPASRDLTETVSTLSHMARFVIADITDAKSIPQELMAIVPNLPSVPVQPLLLATQREYGMFEYFKRFPWVLEPYMYDDQDGLLAALTDRVIGPAEAKAKEQTGR